MIAKIGDKISWVFDNTKNTVSHLRGKKFNANVAMVDYPERVYGVYAEYGQDLIPFDDATIEQLNNQSIEPEQHTVIGC